jgi:hypothetical protein
MAYFPIAFIAPNYRDYNDYWLKAYDPGTTTPKAMALDSAAGSTIAKLQLNADGFLKSAGGALVIPYLSGAYDLYLFPTGAEADSNTTTNAIKVADNITGVLSDDAIGVLLINDLSQAYEFDDVAAMTASAVVFPIGKAINTKGYYVSGDGGGAGYILTSGSSSSVGSHDIDGGNYSKLIIGDNVNIKQWGAKDDGTDTSAEIQAAINELSSITGMATLYVPEGGIFRAQNIRLQTGVIIKGETPMNGWARIASGNYTKGSVLKLVDGANNNLIFINKGTQNCGVVDLILDGNKANQTSYSSNCLYAQDTDFRAFGVLIKGNKMVNARGWGAFINGTGPLEMEDNFIMSGLFYAGGSDYKIRGNTIDGTDGLHPALTMHNCRNGGLSDNIIYGWGEDGTTIKTLQSSVVTLDFATNTFTATGGIDWIYESAPIIISSTANMPTVSGASNYRVYFVTQVVGNTFKLESKVPLTTGSTTVNFIDSGTGVLTLHHGSTEFEEAVNFDSCSVMRATNNRCAGAKGSQMVMNLCNNIQYSNNVYYSSNHRNLPDLASLEIRDCQKCSFSNNQLGTLVSEGSEYAYSVRLSQSFTECQFNKFDMSNQYLATTTGILIKDESVQSYKNRNLFDGVAGIADAGTQRISSVNFFRQPLNQVVTAEFAATAIPNNLETTLGLTAALEIGGTVNATDIQLQTTADGLYRVSGQITITGFTSGMTAANLQVSGFATSANTVRRFDGNTSAGITSTRFAIPFSFDTQSTIDGLANLQFKLYLFGAGAGTTVMSTPERSFVSVTKLSETTRSS